MNRFRICLTMLLATAPAAAFADGFAPGQWSHWTDMVSAEVPGVPQWVVKMFAGNSKRKSCFTAAQATSRPEALLTQDDAAVCKPRKFAMEGGKFVYDTFCTNKRFPDGLMIASKGTYTPNSYTIATTSTGTKDGKPVKIITTGGGQRTGACK
ncbi:DUF3617 domain-containing protein [Sphingomonas crocodyli]|uniref:DUF3617 family protein n=1 Tax=Sphingomonas crocodyli TaxID=1979270 RepID=A0A437M8K1_9SPHN|nr:DUF3617 family protein [Sphingomonas crocodyli]RVT93824.1 DUF3617 family protein [Sphingomonas crocodyli]